MPSRRDFLRTGSLAALAGSAWIHAPARAAGASRDPAQGRARNVIFMVSDGMSFGTLSIADQVARMRHQRASHWVRLMNQRDARRALMETSASNSMVTDSAAGGSAWGNGNKTPFQSVNILADGSAPAPIFVRARQAGKATGLVTTTRITHATPASFIANVPDRDMEDEIAAQMLARGVDVALGGGAVHFKPDQLAAAKDLTVARTTQDLAAAVERRAARLLGLFADAHCPHELDRQPTCPSLLEMTRAALTLLAPAPGGFVLQVEGGRVDHAAHANDAGSLIAEQLAFDDALGAVLDFVLSRDDTLLIVTTDHGNANPGISLYGRAGARGLERAASARHSFEWIFSQLGTKVAFDDPEDMSGVKEFARLRELITQATGITISDDDLAILKNTIQGRPSHPFRTMASKTTSILGGILSNSNAIAFASPDHTADLVEATLWGPASDALPQTISNTELHTLMVRALDLAPVPVAPAK